MTTVTTELLTIGLPQREMITSIILAIILIILVVYWNYSIETLRYIQLGFKVPGLNTLGIIRDIPFAFKNPAELMNMVVNRIKSRGRIVRVWLGNRLTVGLFDPQDIELILGSHVHLEKSLEYRLFEPWLGDGLLINQGEKWKTHRKIIVPTFHHTILKSFIPVFNKNAQELVLKLKKDVIGKECDVHDYMSTVTVDVLLETAMGVVKTDLDNTGYTYAKAVMDMCNIIHLRHYKLWLRPDFIFNLTNISKIQRTLLNTIHKLTDGVIQQKKCNYAERLKTGEKSLYSNAVLEEESEQINEVANFGSGLTDDLDDDVGQKRRLAFLDFLIESNSLSDVEIRDEVNTIMFEGHDTTAAATSFFLCMLGCHQDIQEKVYQEINGIFQGVDRPVTLNDIFEMKYLERVLLETLRLYPPVPIIARVLREEVKLVSKNYTLPKDTTVVISSFIVHRDPELYPNPEKFDPDNFLPEKCQNRNYYSFIPFSAGPRSCVGRKFAMLKMKILLATLVRNFKVTSLVDEKDFKLQGDIILKRADGFRIVFENRVK